jgi:hypothetical protein
MNAVTGCFCLAALPPSGLSFHSSVGVASLVFAHNRDIRFAAQFVDGKFIQSRHGSDWIFGLLWSI